MNRHYDIDIDDPETFISIMIGMSARKNAYYLMYRFDPIEGEARKFGKDSIKKMEEGGEWKPIVSFIQHNFSLQDSPP